MPNKTEQKSNLQEQLEAWITTNREEMVDDIVRLCSVKSVSGPPEEDFPYGNGCGEALMLAGEIAGRRGFMLENHQNHCGTISLPGRTNRTIGLFCHLDVVPEGQGWTTPPYSPIVKDGYIFARGASDNKGPCVAALCLLQALRELGIELEHTVQLYYGCSEELAMEDLAWYLEHFAPPEMSITPDASFSVCHGEKGILSAKLVADISDTNIFSFEGGDAPNVIAAHACLVIGDVPLEKARRALADEFEISEVPEGICIRGKGVSAHAAFPDGGVSAIAKLAAAVAIAGLANGEGNRVLAAMGEAFATHYGDGLGIAFSDKESGCLTAAGGVVTTKNGQLVQSIDVRYPVTANSETIVESLRNTAKQMGFSVIDLENTPPSYIPPEHPLIQTLNDTCNEILGTSLAPYVMGGGTYARKLPMGVAYGPLLRSRERPGGSTKGGGHQADECVSIEGLEDMLRVYLPALMRIDRL